MSTQTMLSEIPQWSLSNRLRKAREHRDLTQQDLSDATGVSRRSISTYESGVTVPSRPQLLAWAMVTGVSVDWLVSGKTNPHPDDPSGGFVLPRLDSNQQPSGYTSAQVITGPWRTIEPVQAERIAS